MSDDGIRERHGMACRHADETAQAVEIFEGEHVIWFERLPYSTKMTTAQARYLARKLYRLARRIDRRGEEE